MSLTVSIISLASSNLLDGRIELSGETVIGLSDFNRITREGFLCFLALNILDIVIIKNSNNKAGSRA